MSDIFDNEKRSYIMSKVRSKNNKSTELELIKFFKENNITGWKRNYPVKGHPDFVFLDKKIAIFVDGCFWHGHENCLFSRLPKTRTEWWKIKISKNIKRDKEKCILLHNLGWHTMTVWSCQLKSTTRKDTLEEIVFLLQKIFLEQNKI